MSREDQPTKVTVVSAKMRRVLTPEQIAEIETALAQNYEVIIIDSAAQFAKYMNSR